MKPRHGLLLFAIVLTVTLAGIAIWKSMPVYEEYEDNEATSGVKGQLWSFWWQRAYPDPTNIHDKWWAAWEHEQALRMPDLVNHPGARNYGNWQNLSMGNGPGGRMLALAIHPTNTNTVFAGSAGSGIWKTTDGGTNWTHMTLNLPVLGVSSIIINSSNPDIMYAGTGEVYRSGNSNIGYSIWKGRGTYGIGVIKSTDGGVTWTQSLVKTNASMFGIQKLTFGHNGYDTVYACATDGLYRSTDAGGSWTNIAPGKTYVSDVVIHDGNTNQMMIAVGNLTDTDKGIYRTTDGKNALPTWTKLTTGIPTSFTGFTRFAYVGGNTVLASFANISGNTVRRSTNFGTGWTTLSNSAFNEFQHWCTNLIKLNPHNTDQLILGGVGLYRYTISSQSRTSIQGTVHDDMHDVAWASSSTVYVACDGGIYKSTNGGTSWSKMNNGLNATQFYAPLGVSTTTANLFLGGLQDNGAWRYSGGTWTQMSWMGGDGTACGIKPGDNNTMIASRDARGIYRSTNGGGSGGNVAAYWGFVGDSRTGFAAPIAFAPSAPATVYCATDVLHKSSNSGGSWSNATLGPRPPYPATTPNNHMDARHKTGIALAVSPTNADKLYISTSPFAQYDNDVDDLFFNPPPGVVKSTNGGTSFTSIKSNLPDYFVTDFAISPTNDDSVFVTLGGYGTNHVWVTGNGGTSWTALGNGLPDVPFNSILIDRLNPKFIYAGSDMGIYVSNNRGQSWFAFSNGFDDVTMVFDLQMTADNKIVAATHGRGLWIADGADNFPLPTQLLSFTGQRRNEFNELKWEVSDDKDAVRYELERKVDNGNYIKVATISSRNSTNQTAYTHNDDIRGSNGTNYYYRLKIIDRDGSYLYSSVVLLKVTRPAGVEILGNPVTSATRLRLTVTDPQPVLFKLYDSKGSLVRSSKVDAPGGSSMHPISMFGILPKGHYTLEVITSSERFTKRLVAR